MKDGKPWSSPLCVLAGVILAAHTLAVPASAGRDYAEGLERDLMHWFRDHRRLVTREILGFRTEDPLGQYESAPVDNDIDAEGQLGFSVKGFVARYDLHPRQFQSTVPVGTALYVGDVRYRAKAIDFDLLFNDRAARLHADSGKNWYAESAERLVAESESATVGLRLLLGKKYDRLFTADQVLALLSRVFDLGPAYRKHVESQARLDRLTDSITALDHAVSDARLAMSERYERAKELSRLLQEAISLRRALAAPFQREPEGLEPLEARLTRLQDSELRELADAGTHERREQIEKQYTDILIAVGAAEDSFQENDVRTRDRVSRAAELVVVLTQARKNRAEASSLSLGSAEELSRIDGVLAAVEEWMASTRRAVDSGCATDGEPLSLESVLDLVSTGIPDLTIAVLIQKCGVSFEPTPERLRALGDAGSSVAIRDALEAQPSPWRPSFQALPRLTSAQD